MLLDEQLPRFDFAERHEATVRVSPAAAFAAIRRADLGSGPLTRALFALRALPGLVVSPRATARRFLRRGRSTRVTLDALASAGFVLLAEHPGREVVLGTIGRFWRPSGGMRPFASAEFARFDEPGWAKGAWNFRVDPAPGGATISTETRVLCTDARSRRTFGRYWRIVRPFSGLIRIEMLRAIRREAERAG
jgi:hypothetical protein